MESQTGSQAGLLSGGLVGKALPFLFLLFQLLQTTAAYQSAAYFCLLLISKPGKQKQQLKGMKKKKKKEQKQKQKQRKTNLQAKAFFLFYIYLYVHIYLCVYSTCLLNRRSFFSFFFFLFQSKTYTSNPRICTYIRRYTIVVNGLVRQSPLSVSGAPLPLVPPLLQLPPPLHSPFSQCFSYFSLKGNHHQPVS